MGRVFGLCLRLDFIAGLAIVRVSDPYHIDALQLRQTTPRRHRLARLSSALLSDRSLSHRQMMCFRAKNWDRLFHRCVQSGRSAACHDARRHGRFCWRKQRNKLYSAQQRMAPFWATIPRTRSIFSTSPRLRPAMIKRDRVRHDLDRVIGRRWLVHSIHSQPEHNQCSIVRN